MLQIIGALCIFFFIIVPVVNFFLRIVSTPDARTPEQKVAAKVAYQTKKQKEEYLSRRKKMVFFIKYPYLLPGIFALFVIMGSASSPPQVNRLELDGWTIAITAMLSYLYRQLLKSSLKKMDGKYSDTPLED